MSPNIFHLPLSGIGFSLLIGALCAIVYLFLLWKTVQILPQVKHKGIFLFISMALRIFLLLAVMILFSNNHAGRFLYIFCAFVIIRLFILRLTGFKAYDEEQNKHLKKAFQAKKGKR